MTHAASPDRWFDDADFVRLAATICDGTATLADRDRLEAILADPRARDAYRLLMQVHADLAWRWKRRDEGTTRKATTAAAIAPTVATAPPEHRLAPLLSFVPSPAALPVVLISMVVAVAASLAVVGTWMQSASLEERITFGTASGRIMSVRDAVWRASETTNGVDPQPGTLLVAGTKLSMSRGFVQIAQPCGAKVILEGPCTFTIQDGESLAIDRGRLTASLDGARRARRRAGGPRFTVNTPTAVVTDLGTAFGVDVNGFGHTDVEVFTGVVEVAPRRLVDGTPLRLTAGEAARTVLNAAAHRIPAAAAGKFIRWMPSPGRRPPAAPGGIQWDESQAVTIYRDSLAGSGPLLATTPASRGGVGDKAWIAPAEGWTIGPSGPGLSVKAGGAAFLPFRPEPGCVYRLSVAMDVTAGGSGWAALGFAEEPNVEDWILDRGWMLQRHEVRTAKGRAMSLPNVAYGGPRQSGRVGDGDTFCGPRTRTIILDTTGPTWRALFLVGDELVGECRFDDQPDTIRYVALSVFPDTAAVFHSVSLQALASPALERR